MPASAAPSPAARTAAIHSAALVETRMADGVDAAVDPVQRAGTNPLCACGAVKPEIAELHRGDHSVLTSGEPGQLRIEGVGRGCFTFRACQAAFVRHPPKLAQISLPVFPPMLLFRAATAKDVQPTLALWAASRSGHAETPDSAEAVQRLLDTDPGSLLVADDGEVIGALIAAFDGWRGNMYRLAVRHDRRREGVAKRLVEHGEARLKQKGAVKVTALVGRGDEQAEALWRAAGYRDDVKIGRWVRSF